MITSVLGWFSTILILVGFLTNANKKFTIALIIWIIGDVGWIIYDYLINNWSHATLSTIIIFINLYGLYKQRVNDKK